ncbi:adenosine deaminase 2-like isoform X1 [Homarus americanus]|uniref:adenosine deaminase 2-like isoform X1 n=2 Tax=Homarus americanus TaxID=6706 RepID=UPI001C44C1CC|nr:adenosine deaminase 2-like isoform X1 [Homarus americanus]
MIPGFVMAVRQRGWWWTLVGLLVLACASSHAIDLKEYLEERAMLLAQEQTTIMGQEQVLSADEQAVNKELMLNKMREMDKSFETHDFPPSKNFMSVRHEIEASDVFKMIQQMPKGAALHLHDTAMASSSWVVEEISYWPNLYMCYTKDDQLLTMFFETPDTTCDWQLMSEVRESYPSADEFDQELLSRLSILTDNPDEKYPDLNSVWSAFQGVFIAITGMLMYRPAWESYLYRAHQEFAHDNVLYIEFRGTLPLLYELNGTMLTEIESAAVYRDTAKRFLDNHPDQFFGTRYIYAPPRLVDNATMEGYVALVRELRAQFPDFVAGFDLVGQEDLGNPLIDFLAYLLPLHDAQVPVFYHSGETAWMGTSTDENLVDALLLNATRIGHGYAITKHPEAKQLAIEKDVPLEICPISNQVLKLVADLRNHPAAGLVAEGFPVVVSSDDPGFWGAVGISHDFYEAFMALGGAKADLRFLKQLAINSIMYSTLDEEAKSALMLKWVEKWDEFIATTNRLNSCTSKKFYPVTSSTSTLGPSSTHKLF